MKPYDKFEVGDILKINHIRWIPEDFIVVRVIAKNKKNQYKFKEIHNPNHYAYYYMSHWTSLSLKHEKVIKLDKDEVMLELL